MTRKWFEMARTKNGTSRPRQDVGFGAKSPGTNRRNYPNAQCSMKAYISHKIIMCLILQSFFSLNLHVYVTLCDEKQIDDVKMKFGLFRLPETPSGVIKPFSVTPD